VIGADNSVTIDLKNGDKWTTANGIDWAKLDTFVNVSPTGEKFDAQTWASMSAADRTKAIDALPATSPDGYTKGNESTVKDNLVVYRDVSGKAVEAYDLLTGKFESMAQAGIAEFSMKDGGKYEMQSYDTVEDALKYVSLHSKWVSGDIRTTEWFTFSNPKAVKLGKVLLSIPSYKPIGGPYADSLNPIYTEIYAYKLGGGTVIIYQDNNTDIKTMYVDGIDPVTLYNQLHNGTVRISGPDAISTTPTVQPTATP
jgi:hypothetical protein